jgi:hypothetical protein
MMPTGVADVIVELFGIAAKANGAEPAGIKFFAHDQTLLPSPSDQKKASESFQNFGQLVPYSSMLVSFYSRCQNGVKPVIRVHPSVSLTGINAAGKCSSTTNELESARINTNEEAD